MLLYGFPGICNKTIIIQTVFRGLIKVCVEYRLWNWKLFKGKINKLKSTGDLARITMHSL